MSEQDEAPDMRTNLLRLRCRSASARAYQGPARLAPSGGNPLAGALSRLEDAWVSPSRDRTVYAEELEGVGSAVTAAFDAQGRLCSDEAASEPAEVDADDPYEGWKASSARIDARVGSSRHHGGY
ncbi:hypothetical protein Q9R32_14560 [Actinotalea sp. AC32]|nr:hypothetical protein [Actinotalea sp. AC32]